MERWAGPGVDLEGAPAGGIEAIRAELVGQPDDAEAGAAALLGVLAFAHHDLGEGGDVGAHARRPGADLVRRPVFAEAVMGRHVVALCGVLPVTGGAHRSA